MTCEELLTQLNAQTAAGDTAGANATLAQMQQQNCQNIPGGQSGGTGRPKPGNG